jgi:hypothetical protein
MTQLREQRQESRVIDMAWERNVIKSARARMIERSMRKL